MIDRTEFELRLAAHHAAETNTNRRGWRHGAARTGGLRAALAAARIALAARLATPRTPASHADGAIRERGATT